MIEGRAGVGAILWRWAAAACVPLVAFQVVLGLVLAAYGVLGADRLERAVCALRGEEAPPRSVVVERLPEAAEQEVQAARAATEAEARRRRAELDALGSWLRAQAATLALERREVEAARVRVAADRRELEAAQEAAQGADRDAAFRSNVKLLERLDPEEAAGVVSRWPAAEVARYLRGLRERPAARVLAALTEREPDLARSVEDVLRGQAGPGK